MVLVGNLYAVRNIQWHEDLNSEKQYFAGELIAGGLYPSSIQQLFRKTSSKPVLVESGTDQFPALVLEVIHSVNEHSETMTGENVADGIVEWR